jgi:hypothetical protein
MKLYFFVHFHFLPLSSSLVLIKFKGDTIEITIEVIRMLLDAVEKIETCHYRESNRDTPVVQPVARQCID